jgi:hypothetical protein
MKVFEILSLHLRQLSYSKLVITKFILTCASQSSKEFLVFWPSVRFTLRNRM